MHLAMSVALEFFEAASADLDCRPQRPFDGDFRVSTLPFDRVLTQIQTATPERTYRADIYLPAWKTCLNPLTDTSRHARVDNPIRIDPLRPFGRSTPTGTVLGSALCQGLGHSLTSFRETVVISGDEKIHHRPHVAEHLLV